MNRLISFAIPHEDSFELSQHSNATTANPQNRNNNNNIFSLSQTTTHNNSISEAKSFRFDDEEDNSNNNDRRNNNTTTTTLKRGPSLFYEQQVTRRAILRNQSENDDGRTGSGKNFDLDYDYLYEREGKRQQQQVLGDAFEERLRFLEQRKKNSETVLDERVDQALAKPTVIKLFLGGTSATALPTNLNKLKGRVHEILCDHSPRLKHLSPDLATLSSTLIRLDCSHCALETLPEEIGTLRHLQFLNLSHNKLTRFIWSCKSLTKLVELDLSSNNIRYFSPQVADIIFARAASAPKERKAVVDPRNNRDKLLLLSQLEENNNTDDTDGNNNNKSQLARLGLRKIFIDLTGNTNSFVKVANRGEKLNHLIPDEASCVCAICHKLSYISMPYVSARFMHLGEGGSSSSSEQQSQSQQYSSSRDETTRTTSAASLLYEDQKMTGTTPRFNFVPILYPTCSAECTLALQRWQEWLKTIAIVDR